MSRSLNAAYLISSSAHRADNDAGRNHWSAYTAEILDQLGLTAAPVEADALVDSLAGLSTLILPQPAGAWLDDAAIAALPAWVDAGGLLIGFGVEGLDGLFGIGVTGPPIEQPDEWSPSGGVLWQCHPLTGGVIWPLHPDAPAPIISPIRLAKVVDGDVLATLADIDSPAIAYREVGEGACLYFAFDVAQHMWIAHHGRPVDADYDGDGYYRLSDAIPAREFEAEVPYADQILFLLRDAIARTGHPLISAIPPMAESGEPADVLLHWGGDGEAAEGTQVPASDFMRDLGLPYHLNLMPDREGNFVVSKEQFDALKANGHEPSLHYDFQSGFEHPYAFTEAEILQQAEWYEQAYGERAKVSVFHWVHWCGWTEPAEWMLKAGGIGDNSRLHRGSPPLNPANMLGYSFGTSFPYHLYRDHRGGNERMEFISEPITLYECGYEGPTDTTDFTHLHNGLEMAVRYHHTADMFFHPVNVHRYASCREAVRETLRWLDERGVRARHMGNDELAEWWLERSRARVGKVETSDEHVSFTVECAWEGGCVITVPVERDVAGINISAGDAMSVIRDEPWGRWLWVACPSGQTSVRVCWG